MISVHWELPTWVCLLSIRSSGHWCHLDLGNFIKIKTSLDRVGHKQLHFVTLFAKLVLPLASGLPALELLILRASILKGLSSTFGSRRLVYLVLTGRNFAPTTDSRRASQHFESDSICPVFTTDIFSGILKGQWSASHAASQPLWRSSLISVYT